VDRKEKITMKRCEIWWRSHVEVEYVDGTM